MQKVLSKLISNVVLTGIQQILGCAYKSFSLCRSDLHWSRYKKFRWRETFALFEVVHRCGVITKLVRLIHRPGNNPSCCSFWTWKLDSLSARQYSSFHAPFYHCKNFFFLSMTSCNTIASWITLDVILLLVPRTNFLPSHNSNSRGEENFSFTQIAEWKNPFSPFCT